jgi:hypothetical protein
MPAALHLGLAWISNKNPDFEMASSKIVRRFHSNLILHVRHRKSELPAAVNRF